MKAERFTWSWAAFQIFSLDTRSLGAFRILLGSLLLYFSLESILGGHATLANVAVGIFALPFTLGYKTRLATILTWVSMRAAFWGSGPTDYGMKLAQLLLFWSMFLPLGAAFALDCRGKTPTPPKNVLSMASAAFILQLIVVYFSAGATKDLDQWLRDPVALEVILRNPRHGTPVGQYLASHFPGLLAGLSVATVIVELFGPFLLFLPTPNQWPRTVMALVFIFFLHVGLIATMYLWLFPYICIAAWVAVLPAPVWDWLWARRGLEPKSEPEIAGWSPVQIFVAVAVAYVPFANYVVWYPETRQYVLVRVIFDAGVPLGLPQSWAMFNRPKDLVVDPENPPARP